MNLSFTSRKGRERKAKQIENIKKAVKQDPTVLLEIIACSAILDTHLGAMRTLLEDKNEIHGFVQLEITRAETGEKEKFPWTPVKTPWFDNLFTDAGRDFGHAQVYTNTSAGTAGANYIGLTTDTAAANAADTSLASEITTGGLARAQATSITHTTGTNVTTLVKTFTASSAFTALHKAGLFNAAGPPVNGTMVHETVFPADVTLQIGDTIQVTWVITYG